MTRPLADDLPGLERAARSFLDAYREGSPARLRGLGPLFGAQEVFEWIKRAHPPERARTAPAKIDALKREWGVTVAERDSLGAPDPGRPAELYRDGALLLEPAPFLPGPEHERLEDWIAEVGPRLGADPKRGFGMQAPGIECAGFDALERLQILLGPVLAETGPRTYRYNAFLGDYRKTPFGYHVDPHQEAVFQVVLVGRREAHFWSGLNLRESDAAWVEDSNDLTRPPAKPELRFELEPGDVVFWPGSHVHGFVAEGPSLALSMVIDRAAPCSRAELVRALELQTAGGRPALPPVDEQAFVSPGDILRRRARFPIAWARHEEALIVSVCGRSFEWPDDSSRQAATRLLAALNERERLAVDELIEERASESLPPEDIGELLTLLTAWGFFSLANEAS